MKISYLRTYIVFTGILLLTGCLYPQEQLQHNRIPNQEQLEMVERAVDAYVEEKNGLVPIQTKENYTSVFEKYPLDFQLLREQHLIAELPGNAFENGGIYQYVLITPEEDPRVKLIDIHMADILQKLHVKIDAYRTKEIYPPFGTEIEEGIFKVNYERLSLDREPYVTSPYSHKNLPIIMNKDGELFIDYRIDLLQALKEFDHDYEEGDDIRYLISDHTPFALPYSLPYTVKDGEPLFMLDE